MFLIGVTQRSISSTAASSSVAVGAELLPLVGVGEQLVHAAGDDVARRLVAADEDQQRLVDQLSRRRAVAVDLGVHEHAHQVVAGARCAAVGDRRSPRRRCSWRRRCRLGHRLLGRRVAQRRAPCRRTTARRSERSSGATPRASPIITMRQRRGDVTHEVALAALAHRVDDLVADGVDLGLAGRGPGGA